MVDRCDGFIFGSGAVFPSLPKEIQLAGIFSASLKEIPKMKTLKSFFLLLVLLLTLAASTNSLAMGVSREQRALQKANAFAMQLAAHPERFANQGVISAMEAPIPQTMRVPADGFDITSATVGFEAAGVPCFNCVPDADFNMGLSVPQTVLLSQTPVEYTMTYVNEMYDGPCTKVIVAMSLVNEQIFGYGVAEGTCTSNSVGIFSTSNWIIYPQVPAGEAMVYTNMFAQTLELLDQFVGRFYVGEPFNE